MSKSKNNLYWKDLLFVNLVALGLASLLLLVGGCGTGIGNPTGPNLQGSPVDEQHSARLTPSEQYSLSSASLNCGSFANDSKAIDVENGRQCILQALSNCLTARYLLNLTENEETTFSSFVEVQKTDPEPLSCQLFVHTVSTGLAKSFIGDEEKTCLESEVDPLKELEFQCGIGEESSN